MRILVACEESQAVTKAFRALGHKAFSCDILPCSGGHAEWHIQKDVLPLLKLPIWDMIIAFPPCTHLSVAGAPLWKEKQADGRQQEGINFFMLFANAPCSKIAIENPVGIMSRKYRKPDQIINPYQFGDPFLKRTCLWLKNLPLLNPTNVVEAKYHYTSNSTRGGLKKDGTRTKAKLPSFGANTSCERSKTFPGIAAAMAEQWGQL